MSRFRKRNEQSEHHYVEERLSAYLDGQLLPQERGIVERHLATCRSCQWDLTTLQQTVQWTRELPTVPVPRAFTIPAPARSRRAARRRWTFVPLLQGATALVALLLFFVVAGDVMLTGLLPSSTPRRELAPAADEPVTVVEEVVVSEAVVEKEAEVVVEQAVAELTYALPTEPVSLEESAFAATATMVADAAEGTGGGEAQEEKVAGEASVPAPDVTQPETYTPTLQFSMTPTWSPSLAPGASRVTTATAVAEVGPTLITDRTPAPAAAVEATHVAIVEPSPTAAPTLAPESTAAVVEMPVEEVEAVPTVILPALSPEPPKAAAPTALARYAEPAEPVPAEGEPEAAPSPRVPGVAWLRVVEAVLAATFVLLGVTTIVSMLLRRKSR